MPHIADRVLSACNPVKLSFYEIDQIEYEEPILSVDILISRFFRESMTSFYML